MKNMWHERLDYFETLWKQGEGPDLMELVTSNDFPKIIAMARKSLEPSWQEMIREFHDTFELGSSDTPTLRDTETRRLRYALIKEELGELVDAYINKDLTEVADALGDLIYVVVGAAVAHGLDLDGIVKEIHRSNMSKVGGHKREDGKWVKPDTYSPADLSRFVASGVPFSDGPILFEANDPTSKVVEFEFDIYDVEQEE